mmetsp:Transcript_29491/g.74203  ORF Transcript_29491/g.74203 Transcript_29491/m.74203 type:complete len:227 (-) Transcript_29491:742-1422(-)
MYKRSLIHKMAQRLRQQCKPASPIGEAAICYDARWSVFGKACSVLFSVVIIGFDCRTSRAIALPHLPPSMWFAPAAVEQTCQRRLERHRHAMRLGIGAGAFHLIWASMSGFRLGWCPADNLPPLDVSVLGFPRKHGWKQPDIPVGVPHEPIRPCVVVNCPKEEAALSTWPRIHCVGLQRCKHQCALHPLAVSEGEEVLALVITVFFRPHIPHVPQTTRCLQPLSFI